jgi:hypothetical protein
MTGFAPSQPESEKGEEGGADAEPAASRQCGSFDTGSPKRNLGFRSTSS